MTKIRVAILFGGSSNEREISFESGRNVVYKIPSHKYEVIPLFVDQKLVLHRVDGRHLVHSSTAELANSLTDDTPVKWSDLPIIADFVFVALHGGVGENGSVQGMLEMMGMPYNGSSVFTSALCMDKYKTNRFLQAQGFHIPRGILIEKKEWLSSRQAVVKKISDIPFPLIAKPHDDGCSVLVYKVANEQELAQAVAQIFNQKEYALIEECVTGMELTVGIIGNKYPRALPPSQAIATNDILSIEEKFLPGAGENQTPAPLPAQTLSFVQKVIEGIYQTVQCKGYARIDCFYQNAQQSPTKSERVVVLEINSLPGLTPATVMFHQAAEIGISPTDFLDMIIELGFEAHQHAATAYKTVLSEQVILQPITTHYAQAV